MLIDATAEEIEAGRIIAPTLYAVLSSRRQAAFDDLPTRVREAYEGDAVRFVRALSRLDPDSLERFRRALPAAAVVS